jgi:diaminopimelate decarboxylase
MLTTADTFEELEKIQRISKDMKVLWRLSIKEDSNVTTLFSNKFGDDIKSLKEAEERFTAIKKMGITLEGIHFHCGSGQHGSSTFDKAVQMARACISLGRKYGHRMETLDIGGGFPAGELNTRLTEALQITKDDPLGKEKL